MIWSAIVAFRLMALSQALLFGIPLLTSNNRAPIRYSGALLVLAIICYLVTPLAYLYVGSTVTTLSVIGASLVPPLLVVFVCLVFDDRDRIANSLWWGIGLYAAFLIWSEVAPSDLKRWFIQLPKLGFLVFALALVWRGRTHDLLEWRLRLRFWLVVGISGAAISVVFVEVITNWQVPQWFEALGMGAIFLLALGTNLLFLRRNPDFGLANSVVPLAAQTPQADPANPVITQLQQRMLNERLYADHDLRIGRLAALMQIPEYQLRRLINQELGYSNFNQFVNQYRIDEASDRLLSDQHSPVLTIALDVGFRSISSFNTAFRVRHGMSPTNFRAESLTNT